MSWLKTHAAGARIALVAVAGLVFGASAEVSAETVYTWTTDDGTVAYTDEDKRVPARYRDRVQVETLDGLVGYDRFTRVDEVARAPEAQAAPSPSAVERVRPVVVAEARKASTYVLSGGGRYGGGTSVAVPVGSMSGSSDEPIVIESLRVKLDDSMATTHETVVRQGDRVISVRRNESSQRDGTGMVPPID